MLITKTHVFLNTLQPQKNATCERSPNGCSAFNPPKLAPLWGICRILCSSRTVKCSSTNTCPNLSEHMAVPPDTPQPGSPCATSYVHSSSHILCSGALESPHSPTTFHSTIDPSIRSLRRGGETSLFTANTYM